MDAFDARRLMHAVLDGDASPEERAALQQVLANDPAARGEFDALRRLFDGLAALPRVMPPSGFVERTVAALPRGSARGHAARQLISRSGVIEPTESDIRVRNVIKRVNTSRTASEAIWGSEHMSKSKRGLWIVGGVAAAVVAMFVGGVVDFPPKGDNATGTIAPAERHRGQQPNEIKLNEGGGGATTRPVLATEPVPGNQGLGASNQGIGSANQGLGSANQGLGSSNQGIGSANQGIGSSNQGLGSSNQGLGSSNQGLGS
ncbi:MAG TPA: hypothetical protein VFX05_09980, partial [Casimicrobiaceae bacterium]|nr:hypothetical protein [Casimicrobiaceae bacterium]